MKIKWNKWTTLASFVLLLAAWAWAINYFDLTGEKWKANLSVAEREHFSDVNAQVSKLKGMKHFWAFVEYYDGHIDLVYQYDGSNNFEVASPRGNPRKGGFLLRAYYLDDETILSVARVVPLDSPDYLKVGQKFLTQK